MPLEHYQADNTSTCAQAAARFLGFVFSANSSITLLSGKWAMGNQKKCTKTRNECNYFFSAPYLILSHFSTMKLREYNQLRLAEQASYLQKKGVYLMTRKDDHFHITLYSVDSFFVELWTDTQGDGIFTIIPFKDADNIQCYTEELPLGELLE